VFYHFLHYLTEVLASVMAKSVEKECDEDFSGAFLCAWGGDESSLYTVLQRERESERERETGR
jgi:hypothetical protein